MHLHGGKDDSETLAAHFPHVSDVQQLAGDVVKMLETNDLISPEKRERIQRYLGLAAASEESDRQQHLDGLLSSIKADRLGDRSASSGAQRAETAPTGAQVRMLYLPASDKVLMSRNNELKLVSRESGGNGEFFADPMSVHFGNRIQDIFDEVNVFITPSELGSLVDLLDWS